MDRVAKKQLTDFALDVLRSESDRTESVATCKRLERNSLAKPPFVKLLQKILLNDESIRVLKMKKEAPSDLSAADLIAVLAMLRVNVIVPVL